jgi:hypothetical protein
MAGTIEITMPKLITPARTDQNSRRLGRFPDTKINGTAVSDVSTASRGLMENSVTTPSLTFH